MHHLAEVCKQRVLVRKGHQTIPSVNKVGPGSSAPSPSLLFILLSPLTPSPSLFSLFRKDSPSSTDSRTIGRTTHGRGLLRLDLEMETNVWKLIIRHLATKWTAQMPNYNNSKKGPESWRVRRLPRVTQFVSGADLVLVCTIANYK